MIGVAATFTTGRHRGFDIAVVRLGLTDPMDRLGLGVIIGPPALIQPSDGPYFGYGDWEYTVWRDGPGYAVLRDTLAEPALLPAALDWWLAHRGDPPVLRYQVLDAIGDFQPITVRDLVGCFDGQPTGCGLAHLAALENAEAAGLVAAESAASGARQRLWLTGAATGVLRPSTPDITGYAAFRHAAAELVPARFTSAPATARASFGAAPTAAATPADAPIDLPGTPRHRGLSR